MILQEDREWIIATIKAEVAKALAESKVAPKAAKEAAPGHISFDADEKLEAESKKAAQGRK